MKELARSLSSFIDAKMKYTEPIIQHYLTLCFLNRSSVRYDVNNVYVFNWESDKFFLTRSGYIYEIEIKISRSDFKNDFNKTEKHDVLNGLFTHEKYMPKFWEYYERNKRYYPTPQLFEESVVCSKSLLTDGNRAPNYFYYAVPDGLIDISEVPPYAGLIYIGVPGGPLATVKKAPKLHTKKYTDAELNLAEKFYYRYKNEHEHVLNLEDSLHELLEQVEIEAAKLDVITK